MSEHGPPANDRGRPVLRWAAPTRGYVTAAAASVLITNGAGVVWQCLSLASESGGGGRGGGWLSVTAAAVLLLGMVAVVDRARRPRPWAPGSRARRVWGSGPATGSHATERSDVRCGARCGVGYLEAVGEPEAGSPPPRGCP